MRIVLEVLIIIGAMVFGAEVNESFTHHRDQLHTLQSELDACRDHTFHVDRAIKECEQSAVQVEHEWRATNNYLDQCVEIIKQLKAQETHK